MSCSLLKTLFLALAVISGTLLGAKSPDIPALIKSATQERFPDAKSVLVYDLEVMTYQKDGTSVETDEFYQKILTEAGRKELSKIPLHCNTNFGSAEFSDCFILRDGKKITFDLKKHTTVTTSSEQMSSNIYDPEIKEIILTVPGLQIGDTLFIKTQRKTLKPLIPGEWSTINLLESDVPILRYDVEINAPKELPLRNIALKNEVPGTVKTFKPQEKNGRVIYRWQALNVPQAIPEPGMPKLYTCCQRLLAGTAKDWQSISKWYYSLCRPGMDAVSDEMIAKVKELTSGAKDDDEKISRIFKFVSQNIRYTGVTAEKNAPGFEPHDVRDTFRQRHGVCRDKAALLASMLELAGIKAYPALFMAGTPKDSDVPNGYFNHAVTCVDKGNFNYVMMDPTDENTRTLFPEYLANQSFLVARKEGDVLRKTPVISPEKNLMKISSEAEVDDKGVMKGVCRIELNGINDLIYRSSFSRMTQRKRSEFWQGRIRRALPGAKLEKLEILPADIRNTAQPVTVEFSFSADNALPETSKPAILHIPDFSSVFGTLNWLLPDTALEKRRFPIELDSSCKLVEDFSLKLPRSLEICGIPQQMSGKDGILSWSSSFKHENGKLLRSSSAVISGDMITPDKYSSFKKELQKMASANKRQPIARKDYTKLSAQELAKVFPDSDAVVLASHRNLVISGERSFTDTVTRKVLVTSYAAIKQFSELKIPFFPEREKITLDAAVTLPDGTVHKLAPNSIRIMDMPWTGDIKNIPAGKIMVAALPSVREGAVIEFTLTNKGRYLFPAAGCEIMGEHNPVLDWSFTLTAPQPLKMRTSPVPENATFTRTVQKGNIVRTWKAKNVPEVKKEQGQGDLRFISPHVSFSAVDTKALAKEYNDALTRQSMAEPAAAWKEFTSSNDISKLSKRKAVEALRDFIHKAVRVSGPDTDQIPLETIQTADEVFKRGVATSPERAVLFAAMLKKLGVGHSFYLADKYVFLNHTYSEFNQYSDAAFEAVLVYIPEFNIFLNSSTQYAGIGYTPYSGNIGLNLENGSVNAIISEAGHHSLIRKKYDIHLNNDGSALINVTCLFRGAFFEKMNRSTSEMTPELLRRFFAASANAMDKSAQLKGKYSCDFSKNPGVIKYSVVIPSFAVKIGDYLSFDLPGYNILKEYTNVAGKERTTAYVRNYSCEIALEYRIITPDNWGSSTPESSMEEFGDPRISRVVMRRSATLGEINRSIRLTLPAAFVEPDDFDRMIKIQNVLGRKENSTVILQKRATGN